MAELLVKGVSKIKIEQKWIGIPFVWGGRDFKGTDCAGLGWMFLKSEGIEVPDSDNSAYGKGWDKDDPQRFIKGLLALGKRIEKKEDLKPLDIVCFEFKGKIIHVGIYAGYGEFLHIFAGGTSCISKLSSAWGTHFYCGIRPTDLCGNDDATLAIAPEDTVGDPGTIIAIIVSLIISLVISAISSALTPKPPTPNFGEDGPMEGSVRYGFGLLQNTATSELPIPVLYGKLKLAPNSVYQSDPGDIINRCDVLCEGEANSVSDVRVNDIPIAEIPGCSYTAYLGTAGQTVDSRFSSAVVGLRNLCYLALTLQSGEKLKGGNPNVTCVVEGTKVEIWDGVTWGTTKTYSQNPAACIRDFLLNIRYGVGLAKTLVDDASFGEAYDYCAIQVFDNGGSTEARYAINFVVDAKKPAVDILEQMLATCAGFLVWSGSKLKLRLEKIENSVQNFTMSNIVEKSFSYQYITSSEMFNRLKLMYIDPSYNYTKVFTISEDKVYQDERSDIEGGNGIVEKETAILGCTSFSQASRLGNMFLRLSKACPLTCKFKVGIYAIHCEVGDKITVSHDVPAWVNKPFRIFSMVEEENDEIALTCKEYNESVYSDSYSSAIARYDYGHPANPYEAVDDVTLITLTEDSFTNADGTFISNIDVSWTKPSDTTYLARYIVEYQRDGEAWVEVGSVAAGQVTSRITNVHVGSSYVIKVRTVSLNNIISTGATSSAIVITGSDIPPDDVSSFSASFSTDAYIFSWSSVVASDLKGYEIRDGATWETGVVIIKDYAGTYDVHRPVTSGTHTFMIKAIDRSGNYSVNAATDSLTVTVAPDLNILVTNYLWSRISDNLEDIHLGTLTGEWAFDWTNRYNSAYNRRTLCLRTDKTFGEMQSTGKTYLDFQNDGLIYGQPLVTGANAIYETDVWDLGAIFSALYSLVEDTDNASIATYTKEIAFSVDNVTWTSYSVFDAAVYYYARYFRIKLTFQTSSLTTNFYINDLQVTVDVPDVMATDGGQGVDIAIGGTIIYYSREFTVPPRSLIVSTVDASSNITAVITSQTIIGFTCTLWNSLNVSVAGKVNYYAKGY